MKDEIKSNKPKKVTPADKPAPVKAEVKKVVAEKVVKAKPVEVPGSIESLKSTLNDITSDLRTPEVWESLIGAQMSKYGYEVVDKLIASGFKEEWRNG